MVAANHFIFTLRYAALTKSQRNKSILIWLMVIKFINKLPSSYYKYNAKR